MYQVFFSSKNQWELKNIQIPHSKVQNKGISNAFQTVKDQPALE